MNNEERAWFEGRIRELEQLLENERAIGAEARKHVDALKQEYGKLEEVCVQWMEETERLRIRVAELEEPQQ